MATEQPPVKRNRTDAAENEPHKSPSRSEVWYPDGNIVPLAQTTLFKVHKSILSDNSEILRDMFTLSQPTEESDIEGCPVVTLFDSALQVEHMLKALYNRRDQPQPGAATYALARIAHKYKIDHLFEDAIHRLRLRFPSTLSSFLDMPAIISDFDEFSCLETLLLARELDVPSLLPVAYLKISAHEEFPGILWGRFRLSDASVGTFPEADIKACALGRERLVRNQANICFSWLQGACRVQSCRDYRTKWFIRLWQPMPRFLAFLTWEDGQWEDALCSTCRNVAKEKFISGQQKLWELLPSYYNLPPWETLAEAAS
ncbi:hypothetical protein JAAARDRAFT_194538 [Jaapia argillacea MUCL 33604]|uniref:BTB domain-containing protein n=1 Tax=Jaapia argillacea MUCL 33604 TaxID=933084 RepID=A0A067PP12_9AGAM|nr:hypothetical protein JAAARDRAFT_194538 [Jaapia argillacea MUCL 33604]